MDTARLARAVHLSVEEVDDGVYWVRGGARVHEVNVEAGTCDCADFTVHRGSCKHLLAVRLRRGNPDALAALRELVPMPKRPRRRAERPASADSATSTGAAA